MPRRGRPLIFFMSKIYNLSSYSFDVPKELIASYPITPRDHARLLVVDRKRGSFQEAHVYDLPEFLQPGDALIFNDTKVLHAALRGTLKSGRVVDCVLTKKIEAYEWSALAKPAKALKIGEKLFFPEDIEALVVGISDDGERIFRFSKDISCLDLQRIGAIPLPPYMKRRAQHDIDDERYQTVYGKRLGSVAAPTAGLHFTDELFKRFSSQSVSTHFVTLHVGTGTFLPIRTEDIREHKIHEEVCEILPSTAATLNNLPQSARRIAVGTTSCRVLETMSDASGILYPGVQSTRLFIYPGYQFRYIDALFTNFHTPESSLLTLVAAFMGYDLMVEAYAKAIESKFRLFSYGDAMLIV